MVTGTSHDGALFVGDCSDGKFTPGEIRCSNCNEVLEDEIAKQGRRIWFATRCQTSVPIQLGFSWAPLRCTDGGIEVGKSSLEFANRGVLNCTDKMKIAKEQHDGRRA
jgi:hypothetical protein